MPSYWDQVVEEEVAFFEALAVATRMMMMNRF